jgi:hypothetical protein
MEIKLNKELIFTIVLSLLMVSGSFFSVQAACDLGFNSSSPHSSTCSIFGSHASTLIDKDAKDKQQCPAADQGSSEHDVNKKQDAASDSGMTGN